MEGGGVFKWLVHYTMQSWLSFFELFFYMFYLTCFMKVVPFTTSYCCISVENDMLKRSSNSAQTLGRNPRNGLSQMRFMPYSFQGCLLTGCLNGGSCVNDDRKQNYLCLCTKAWSGLKCETKIGKKRYYQLSKVSVSSIFQILTIFSLCLSLLVFNQSKRLVLS